MDTKIRFLRSVTGAEFSDRRRNEDTSRELHIVEFNSKTTSQTELEKPHTQNVIHNNPNHILNDRGERKEKEET
jgi:hypothetical protein